MRIQRLLILSVVTALVLLPTAAQAQQMFVEMEPGETTAAAPYPCQLLHEIYPCYCCLWHVVIVMEADSTLTMENDSEVADFHIDWKGPNYHLETGEMVAPVGGSSTDPVGSSWVETYPNEGRNRVVTSWVDANGDGEVGDLDLIGLDNGEAVRIKETRTGAFLTRLDG